MPVEAAGYVFFTNCHFGHVTDAGRLMFSNGNEMWKMWRKIVTMDVKSSMEQLEILPTLCQKRMSECLHSESNSAVIFRMCTCRFCLGFYVFFSNMFRFVTWKDDFYTWRRSV